MQVSIFKDLADNTKGNRPATYVFSKQAHCNLSVQGPDFRAIYERFPTDL